MATFFKVCMSAFFLTACQQANSPSASPQKKLREASIAQLQELATNACLCDQQSGGGQDCWKDYQAKLKGVEIEAGATACAPISTQMDCFELNGQHTCIITGYSVNDVDWDDQICRPKDAQAAEAAYSTAYNAHPQHSDAAEKAADKALLDALKKIKAGEKLAAMQSERGCT
jgi:hypothetical protein